MASLLAGASLVAHLFGRPFRADMPVLDRAEYYSLISSNITVLMGLLILSDTVPLTFRIFGAVVVMVVNLALIVWIAYQFIRARLA